MQNGPRRALIILLAILSFVSAFLPIPATRVSGDPWITNNPNGTSDAVWNFSNPSDYVFTNTEAAPGNATLARQPVFWWNSTTAADFAGPDSETNIDRATWPGDVTMASHVGPQTLLTLQPDATGEDTYLDKQLKDTNFGAATTMLLDGRNPQYEPLMRFDLSSIPANAVIDGAVLSLYQSAGVGNPVTANLHYVTAQWNELQATWNDRLTGVGWGAAGGDYALRTIDTVTIGNAAGWRAWNITTLVDLWYRGRLTNYGLIIEGPNPGVTSVKTFFASDYNADPTRRPRLDIRYRVLGATSEYISKASGPGTTAAWKTTSWNSSVRDFASDEFTGASLDPKWSWTNLPASYDVGTTTPGSLHVVSSTGTDLTGAVFTGNVLSQGIAGDFTATMKFSANPTLVGQRSGLMVLVNGRNWYAVGKANVGAGVRNWRVYGVDDGVTTVRADVASTNPVPAWLRIQRAGNTLTASTSNDGVTWTTRDTYAPPFEYPLGIRLAFFVTDGLSGTALPVDVDYIRIAVANDATVTLQTRIGDVIPVDGTWSGWSAAYPNRLGSAMSGSSRYIEYRLFFSVWNPAHMASIGDVNLSWFRFAPAGTVETNDLVPTDLSAWGDVSVVQTLNGQTTTFEYSLDSGGSWTPVVPPASLQALSIASGKIRFRVSMSTTNTLITPELREIRVTYTHRLDHFYVSGPPTATAGLPFSVDVTAKDALNATLSSWTGTVTLAARLADGVTPGGGTLGTTTLAIVAGGTATLANETYTRAEVIRILATFGAAAGLSGPIDVGSSPVNRIVVTPDNVTILAFDSQPLTAQGFDVFDNPVPGVNFTWSFSGVAGGLNVTWGPAVTFTANPPAANGTLEASFLSVNGTAQIHVVLGAPPWVTIWDPAPGDHVTGVVPISYTNSPDSLDIRFDYSDGTGWTPIGSTAILNGTYYWDTTGLDFAAGGVQAFVTNNRTATGGFAVWPIEVDNTPPAITITNVVDDQATTGTLTILYATDPDVVRVDLTYFDGAWKPIGSDATVDGTYLWTPGVAINGVTLRAVAVDEVNLTGAAERPGVGSYLGPNAPAIAPIPDLYVLVGATYRLNLTFYISDPDTPLSALVVSVSDGANVTAVSGAYPYLDVTYAAAGTYLVTLWVSDGSSTAWTIVRVIASANSPPALVVALPAVAFDEDATAWNALAAPTSTFFSDPDADPLAFAVLDGANVFARVNANDTIDLWATANWSGTETLRLRASDPSGGFAEAAFRVTVRPVNDAPVLVTAFPAVSFDEDTTAFDVFAGDATLHFFDVDGDPLTLTVSGGVQVSARVNPAGTIDLWSAADWHGSETLTVRATDPNATFAEGSFVVTVRPVNDAPTVTSAFTTVTFDEDTTAPNVFAGPVSSHFYDVDGDALTFTILGATQVQYRLNADSSLDLWAAANWSGTETLAVHAQDPGGGSVDAPFIVTVRPVNDAPVLAPVPGPTINEGDTLTLDLAPYISDIDTPMSNITVTTDSGYVTVNGRVLTLAYPTGLDTASFVVTISDGSLTASRSVLVTFNPVWWRSRFMYLIPVTAIFLVVAMFAQRARWKPAKAFLVDERQQMLREFTLDESCDVTYEQAVQAGALDAVEKPVKVAKYHARSVKGDALAVVLLAYGPVSPAHIEFAREMLVNIQDKFEASVTQRLEEVRAAEAGFQGAREEIETAQAALDEKSRALAGETEAVAATKEKLAQDTEAVQAREREAAEREEALETASEALSRREAALKAAQAEIEPREEAAKELEASLAQRQDAVEARETRIGPLEAEVFDRESLVAEREAAVREQSESVTKKVLEMAKTRKELEEKETTLNRERAALNSARASFDPEVRAFQARVATFETDTKERETDLAERTKAFEEARARLDEDTAKFESMRKEKEAWIAGQTSELDGRTKKVTDRENRLKEQSEALTAQALELAKARKELEAREEALVQERNALNGAREAFEPEVKAFEKRVTRFNDETKEKERGIAARVQALEQDRNALDAEVAKFESMRQEKAAWMAKKESELANREASVADHESRAKELADRVDAAAADIAAAKKDLKDREAALVRERNALSSAREAFEPQVKAFEARVAAFDEATKAREADLAARIDALAQDRTEFDGEAAKFESARKEKEAWIAGKESDLGGWANQLADREGRLREQSDALSAQAIQLSNASKDLESREGALARERSALNAAREAFEPKQRELQEKTTQFEEESKRRKQDLDAQGKALGEAQLRLAADRQTFEAARTERSEWIASKEIEIESRTQSLQEKEQAVRAQAEENARRIADLAAREEALEVGNDKLEKSLSEFAAREADLGRLAKTLDAKALALREEEARKAEEYRTWEATLSSQQTLLRQQKETLEKETADQKEGLAMRQIKVEQQESEVRDREAKVRSDVEWATRAEEDIRRRELAIEDAIKATAAAEARLKTGEKDLAARAFELERRERSVREEAANLTDNLARRDQAMKAGEKDLADRRARLDHETANRTRQADEIEANLMHRSQALEAKAAEVAERESKLTLVQRSVQERDSMLSRQATDLAARAKAIEAKELELNQLSARTIEETNRIRGDAEATRRSLAEREADMRSERDRLERESNALQEHLGSKALELANRERSIQEKESENHRERKAVEAERAAWSEHRTKELKQLEATQQAVMEQTQRSEKLIEEAQRRAYVASEAEKAAKKQAEDLLAIQARMDERRTAAEDAERQVAAQMGQLNELSKTHAARQAELDALAKELKAKETKAAASLADASRTWNDAKAREANTQAEAQRIARLDADLKARAADLDHKLAAVESKGADVALREQELTTELQRAENLMEDLEKKERDLQGKEHSLAAAGEEASKREAAVARKDSELRQGMEGLERLQAEIEQRLAEADKDRETAAKAREESVALKTEAEKAKAESEAMQQEVSKNMKFLQKKAVDVLDREEQTRKREEALAETEKSIDTRAEILDSKEKELETDREQLTRTTERLQAEVAKLRSRLESAEKNAASSVDMEEWKRDLDARVKILQKKAFELLDREEKLRKRQEELEALAQKLGVEPSSG